jgi:hypothetical protein
MAPITYPEFDNRDEVHSYITALFRFLETFELRRDVSIMLTTTLESEDDSPEDYRAPEKQLPVVIFYGSWSQLDVLKSALREQFVIPDEAFQLAPY